MSPVRHVRNASLIGCVLPSGFPYPSAFSVDVSSPPPLPPLPPPVLDRGIDLDLPSLRPAGRALECRSAYSAVQCRGDKASRGKTGWIASQAGRAETLGQGRGGRDGRLARKTESERKETRQTRGVEQKSTDEEEDKRRAGGGGWFGKGWVGSAARMARNAAPAMPKQSRLRQGCNQAAPRKLMLPRSLTQPKKEDTRDSGPGKATRWGCFGEGFVAVCGVG
ncbi:hypothetical protein VTK73DRAFT_4290 [Phialemonium thermophilum]|uniref:Uncharacterized protein n=1 Tax=Phialemonium thermophilum TaxID=223376 RepID=A0ABR3VAA0_9PEZI